MNSYTRFFEAKCPSFLLESIYVKSYSDLECCALKDGEDVTILFKNIENKNCQEKGLKLFSTTDDAKKYFNDFKYFLDKFEEKSNLFICKNKPSDLINLFLEFLKFYRWTEAFYTDLSYKNMENNQIIKQNLKELEKIKTKARENLNLFFNGENSYLQRIARASNDKEKLLYSTVDEIINGKEPSMEEIKIRRNDHLLDNSEKIYKEQDIIYEKIIEWKNSFEKESKQTIKGISASLGCVTSKAFVLSANFTNFDMLDEIIDKMPKNVILVSETTAPDIVRACYKAIGIVTNQGGLGSHAAIISRELNIPCVVGTKIATKVIKTGDLITLDGDKGEVIINEQ